MIYSQNEISDENVLHQPFSIKSTTSIDTIESETSSGSGGCEDDEDSKAASRRPPSSNQPAMMTRSATYSAIQTDI